MGPCHWQCQKEVCVEIPLADKNSEFTWDYSGCNHLLIYVTAYTHLSMWHFTKTGCCHFWCIPRFLVPYFHVQLSEMETMISLSQKFESVTSMDRSFRCDSLQFMLTPKCCFPMKPGLMRIKIQITSISESQVWGLNWGCSVIHQSHIADFKFKSPF
jgi:hypothetical protein